jgi:hypothetical protein
MAAGTSWKAGPAYMNSAAADIAGVNPAANTYRKIFHIHLTNTDVAARTVSLYIGATGGSAGGTEILKAKSIAASDVFDMYFPAGLRIVAADFLSGLASVINIVTIEVNGESFVL